MIRIISTMFVFTSLSLLLTFVGLMPSIGAAKNDGITAESCRQIFKKDKDRMQLLPNYLLGANAQVAFIKELCSLKVFVKPKKAITNIITSPFRDTICDLPDIVIDICRDLLKTKYFEDEELVIVEEKYENYNGCQSKQIKFSPLNENYRKALDNRNIEKSMAPCYTQIGTFWMVDSKQKDYMYAADERPEGGLKIREYTKMADGFMKNMKELNKNRKKEIARKKSEEKKNLSGDKRNTSKLCGILPTICGGGGARNQQTTNV